MSWKIAPIGRGDDLLYSQAGTPSLDLRFAGNKNLNDFVTNTPLVDHQRSMSGSNLNPGTFVNSSGLIETAKVNLLTYSEQFENVAWFKGSVTLNPNTAIAPNGSQTADKIIWNNGSTSNNLVRQSSTDRGIATNPIVMYTLTGSGSAAVTSSLPAGSNYDIDPAGDGWYRCWLYDSTADQTLSVYAKAEEFNSIQLQFYTTNRYIYVLDSVATQGNGTSGVYLWGAQLEEGSTATTYIPTTNAPSAAPRFDHDPTTGESLGLLVEESRTNLILDSEQVTSSNWARSNVSVTPNTTTAPNGTLTADSVSNIPSTFSWIRPNGSLNTSLTYTITFFAKPLTTNKLIVLEWQGGNYFDLSNPVSGVEEFADGWFKITLTKTNVSSGPAIYIGAYGPTSDNVTFALWGFQIEQGSFPTSYIPTTSATATRAADVAKITGSNFSSWYNQSEGTWFADVPNPGKVSSTRIINTGVNLWSGPTNAGYVRTSSSSVLSTTSYPAKVSAKYNDSSLTGAVNGILLAEAGGTNVPATYVDIGSANTAASGVGFINNPISRLTYWPHRLPDATLQTITT